MAYTEEQLKAAAKKALAAGDTAAAKRLIDAARAAGSQPSATMPEPSAQPKRGAWDAVVDNVVGRNDGVQSMGESLGTWLNRAGESMTLGVVGDEASAAAYSALPGRTYEGELSRFRGNEANMSTLGRLSADLAGAVVPALTGAGMIAQAPTLLGRVATGAGLGTGAGAVQGFAEGEGGAANRGVSAGIGATGGAIVGAAIPVAGQIARKGLDALANRAAFRKAISEATTPEQARAIANRIYSEADKVTGLPRDQFASTVGDILEAAKRKGLDADLTPGAAKVAGRMTEAADGAENIGFRELDILRRKAAIPAGNVTNPTEQSIATKMIEGIDGFIDSVDPRLSGSIKEARNMWGILRRSELVENAIAKAQDTASGFENGLRIEFRKLLSNPKLRRGFNDAEIKAIKRVVQGSPMGNLMRQVGRVGLGISGQSNGLGATVGALGGSALGGPLGGLATVAAGTAAKAVNERSTRKAAEQALQVILSRNALAGVQPQMLLPGAERALGVAGLSALPTLSPSIGRNALGVQ